MSTIDHAALGAIAHQGSLLEEILHVLRKPEEWGGTGDLERVYWDPAAPNPSHDVTAEYSYDGVFAAVGIFNLSAGVIRVAFTSKQSLRDASSLFTLSARAFIVIPYRGTIVSVSGDAAGSALIVPCEVAQPLNAGVF